MMDAMRSSMGLLRTAAITMGCVALVLLAGVVLMVLGEWHFALCGNRVRVTAHYSCHGLWDTPAVLFDQVAPCK